MAEEKKAEERYATIQLHGIKKIYHIGGEELAALNGITTNIYKGEFAALMGPSGSGKSTLMNILGCLDRPTEGSYKLDGEEVAGLDDDALARTRNKKIGFVFQNFNLFPHYSVLKNIADAPIHVQKRDKGEVYKEAMELLKKMGLEDKADAYPYQLSGGQCQRVAIARALALNPKILFFDEPTSALDPELTGEVLKVIKSLADLDITMVIVTHEMSFARDVADRAIFMDQGRIVEQGEAKALFASPQQPRTRQFLEKFLMQ